MKRISNLLFALVFIIALFTAFFFTIAGPETNYSYYEQRTFAAVPKITWEGVWSGQFFSDVETALSDRFMYRDSVVKLNTWFDLKASRPVVNNVVVNSEVLLSFFGYTYWDTAYLTELGAEIGDGFQSLNEQIKDYGGYFCYLALPLQSTYFAAHYPDYMDSRLWHMEATRTAFASALSQRGVPFIDMRAIYDLMDAPADYYSSTDHHYSYRGAFAAYTELMNRINTDTESSIRVLAEEDLDFVTLPNPYLGSSNRKIYGLWRSEEKLEIGTLKTPIDFTRKDNGTLVKSTLYALPQSESETVTYSLYMGGDIGETVIETNRPELPNVLIFGDSFTNAMETLVWASFNETRSLDLRYFTSESLREYIELYKPDYVICIRDESVSLSKNGNGNIT